MAQDRMLPPMPSSRTGLSGQFDEGLSKERQKYFPNEWQYQGAPDPSEVDDPNYEGMGYIESAGTNNPMKKLKPGVYYHPTKKKRILLSSDGSVRQIPEPTVEIKIAEWAKPILAATSPILLPLFIYEYVTGHKKRSLDSTFKSENVPVLSKIPILKNMPKAMLITGGMLFSLALPVAGFILPVAMLGMITFGHDKIQEARFDEMDFLIASGAKSLKITGKTDAHGNPMPHDKKLFMSILRKAASYGVPVDLDTATWAWVRTLPQNTQIEIENIVQASKLNEAKVALVSKMNAASDYKEKTKALNSTPKLTEKHSDETLKQDLGISTADEIVKARKAAYLNEAAKGDERSKVKGIQTELAQIKGRLEALDKNGKELAELQELYRELLQNPEKFSEPTTIPPHLKPYVDSSQVEDLRTPAQAIEKIESYMKTMEKPIENFLQARQLEEADLKLRLEALDGSLKEMGQKFVNHDPAPGSETVLRDSITAVGAELQELSDVLKKQTDQHGQLKNTQEAMPTAINEARKQQNLPPNIETRPITPK